MQPTTDTPPPTVRKDLTYLNTLLACLLVDESLTVLNNQGFLKRELKQQATRMQRELERVISDDVPLICGENDELLYTLIDAQRDVIKTVARMRPEDAFAVTEIVKRYEKGPLRFQELLEITFIEEDDPRAGLNLQLSENQLPITYMIYQLPPGIQKQVIAYITNQYDVYRLNRGQDKAA